MEASLIKTKDSKYSCKCSPVEPLSQLAFLHIYLIQSITERSKKKNTLDGCFLYSNVPCEINECQCIENLDAGLPGYRIKFTPSISTECT